LSAEVVVALDLGTSSARAIAFDRSAAPIPGARCQISWKPQTEPVGAHQFDADLLFDCVVRCLDGLAERLDALDLGNVLAVGCCSFWHSSVGVDAEGRAVTPVITWADMRAADQAGQLAREMGAERLHAVTGCAPHPSYYPARLLWMRQAQPEIFARVQRWLSPADYVLQRLTGTQATSISMASGTGLFNQHACTWDRRLTAYCGLEERNLPPVVDIDWPLGRLRSPWGERWPVLAAADWMPAIGDGAASNLGSGCAADTRCAINLGTSGAIRVLWEADSIRIPPELWCYRLDRRYPIMGGAFSDAGNLYDWCRRNLALGEEQSLQEQLAERSPGSSGLLVLPFFGGERSTRWRTDSSGLIAGLSLASTAEDVVHAAMEGVALRFGLVWQLLRREFPRLDTLVLSGGAASPAWAQMVVDAVGHPATLSADTEASSRGAALVALKHCGLLGGWSSASPLSGQVLQPHPERHARMRELLADQERLMAHMEKAQ
jgi:gluconokinase